MHIVKSYYNFAPHLQELFEASISVRENAYVPYSKFKVGAALLSSMGTVYTGCNVECTAYSVSTCAERSAIVKAVSDGQKNFVSIAICGKFETKDEFVSPCGVCRQNIIEFATADNDIVIYLVKPNRDAVLETTISSLLPLSFRGSSYSAQKTPPAAYKQC